MQTKIAKAHFIIPLVALFLAPAPVSSQVLLRANGFNTYLFELRSISEGEIESYLSNRMGHEWRQSMPYGSDDLLRSKPGDDWLRKERLKIFPALNAAVYLNGGHVNEKGGYLDIAPLGTIVARYNILPLRRLGLILWTRFEKHSVVSQRRITNLSYDFNRQQEVGRRKFQTGDSTWVEYDVGDGGILLSHSNGEIAFAKSNPIWGPGYTGQLWLSDKVPSYVFVNITQRFGDKWVFSYLHGSLNSTLRDSAYREYYPIKGGMPMVRKYLVAHRLEFSPSDNMRIGFGESVIYGARGVEMAYSLPFLFYWSAQHDLSDTDNLQMFVDFQVVRKNLGRLYGAVFIDEWDFVDTFRKERSRNWAAYQAGITVALPFPGNWNPLLRLEGTHLTPYVYVHRSSINTFQHHGQYLGFWSGPNSDNIFLALEGSPRKGWWVQLYGYRARRGEVNEETIEKQYNFENIPFLYPYENDPETRTVGGLRGELLLSTFIRLNFDITYDFWRKRLHTQSLEGRDVQKLDGMVQLIIGL